MNSEGNIFDTIADVLGKHVQTSDDCTVMLSRFEAGMDRATEAGGSSVDWLFGGENYSMVGLLSQLENSLEAELEAVRKVKKSIVQCRATHFAGLSEGGEL